MTFGMIEPLESTASQSPAMAAIDDPVKRFVSRGLGIMMMLLPLVGVPSEYMLQDTLKSMLASLIVLGLMMWFLFKRQRNSELHWHGLLAFPLVVFLYALGSMAWATNAFLAGVETVRWFIFSGLLWLGLQVFRRENFDELSKWIHAGSVVATAWGLLQFWFDLGLFPQGYAPASTFVNRNFAAEYVVAVFPLSVVATLRTRSPAVVAVMAYTLALNLIFVLACATRSALFGLMICMIPLVAGLWLFKDRLAWQQWDKTTRFSSAGVFIFALLTLGFVPSSISTDDFYKINAFERTLNRAQTVANLSSDPSVGMRKNMMSLTFTMIADHPVLGVGGGNWEVVQPKYLPPTHTLEVDYYLHNEFVQHVAEYGVVGLLSVLGLNALLAFAAWRTWRLRHHEAMREEGVLRVGILCSLFALFVVSCAGFPWRLATTCCLFAIGLAAIGASDLRLGWFAGAKKYLPELVSDRGFQVSKVLLASAMLLAVWISVQATRCEYKLVHAAKLALGLTALGADMNNPQWDATKSEVIESVRAGMAINPHYRKIAPVTADEMVRWGDWKNAVEIWESMLRSRPYVVALMLHAAKGRAAMGEYAAAATWIERVRKQHPNSAPARSVEIFILEKQGKREEAVRFARQAVNEKVMDFELMQNAYRLGLLINDDQLVIDALNLKLLTAPWEAPAIYLKLGEVHDRIGQKEQALQRYRDALYVVDPIIHEEMMKKIPADYAAKLRESK